jgi:hypothetical protein
LQTFLDERMDLALTAVSLAPLQPSLGHLRNIARRLPDGIRRSDSMQRDEPVPLRCRQDRAMLDTSGNHDYSPSMKITVDLSDSDLKEICRVTGEKKKGPAIRKLVIDALMMKRRQELGQKFIDGEWGVELDGFKQAQAADREADRKAAQRGRK